MSIDTSGFHGEFGGEDPGLFMRCHRKHVHHAQRRLIDIGKLIANRLEQIGDSADEQLAAAFYETIGEFREVRP